MEYLGWGLLIIGAAEGLVAPKIFGRIKTEKDNFRRWIILLDVVVGILGALFGVWIYLSGDPQPSGMGILGCLVCALIFSAVFSGGARLATGS